MKNYNKTSMMKKRVYFDMDNVIVDFRSGLDKVDDATKQAACDVVEWADVAGAALEYLRGDIEADALTEADVVELERVADMV